MVHMCLVSDIKSIKGVHMCLMAGNGAYVFLRMVCTCLWHVKNQLKGCICVLSLKSVCMCVSKVNLKLV